MSGELFNPEAFEQIPGQLSMDQIEPTTPKFERNDSLIFTAPGDNYERSGQFWSDEPTCGVTVYGWADGRCYFVGHQDIRPETDDERYQREVQGYYREQLS